MTLVPEHIEFAEAVIVAETGRIGFTAIVMELEAAGFPLMQAAFDVITQLTTFELASVPEVNDGLFVPILIPLSFH